MSSIVLVVESITIDILYHTAIDQGKLLLVEKAKSQARLIEAIARDDKKYRKAYPFGARQATLRKIQDVRIPQKKSRR